MLVLTACGDDERETDTSDDDPSVTGDDGESDAPVTTSPDRRTVVHMFGETVVNGTPERIVTVGLTDQDAVFALGEMPVASQAWYAEQVVYSWAEEALPGIDTEIIPPGELNAETVASYDPDLILAISAEITEQQYDQLSEIAPTVAASADYDAATTPWQVQTTMIGRALGKEDEAKTLVADVEQRFADAAERHPEWQGAEAVLASQYIEGQLLVYPGDSPAFEFLDSLGFTIAPGLDEFTDDTYGVPALSPERLDLIDVDLVLWDGLRAALEDAGLLELGTFRSLTAVQEGRMVFSSPAVADALSFHNVLSLPWALEHLEDPIAAAFDGDPATSAD